MSFSFLFAKNAVQRMCGVAYMYERVGVVVASKLFQRRIFEENENGKKEERKKNSVEIRVRMCAITEIGLNVSFCVGSDKRRRASGVPLPFSHLVKIQLRFLFAVVYLFINK